MTLAARSHRRMDQAFSEALAKDGDDYPAPDVDALVRSRDRGRDARSLAERPPKLMLAELWQRKSADGRTYFTGFLGGLMLVLLREGERDHPTRPGEKVIVWSLLAEHRPRRQGSGGARGARARNSTSTE